MVYAAVQVRSYVLFQLSARLRPELEALVKSNEAPTGKQCYFLRTRTTRTIMSRTIQFCKRQQQGFGRLSPVCARACQVLSAVKLVLLLSCASTLALEALWTLASPLPGSHHASTTEQLSLHKPHAMCTLWTSASHLRTDCHGGCVPAGEQYAYNSEACAKRAIKVCGSAGSPFSHSYQKLHCIY